MNTKEHRYIERIGKAIDFIEANLKEDLQPEAIAERACTSLYHFHRLFHAFMGRSLSEYVRARRLYAAASDLVATKASILDIALTYGYSTSESFLRAFKTQFDVIPSAYRRIGRPPAYRGTDILKDRAAARADGGIAMEAEVTYHEAVKILGVRIRTRRGSCHADISSFWTKLRNDKSMHDLASRTKDAWIYGICFGACAACSAHGKGAQGGDFFSYFVGCRAPEGSAVPEGFYETLIPAGWYASFACRSGRIQETMDSIYSQWLPASGYELADLPIVEKYGSEWRDPEKAEMVIELPVRGEGL